MDNEIKVVNDELALPVEMKKALQELREFEITKLEMANKEKLVKAEIMEAMKANDLKSFACEGITFSYIAPTTTMRVDTKALKEQGLYEQFTKPSQRKESLRVSYD